MKKRIVLWVMICVLSLAAVPGISFAAPKYMNDGVPVWTEETVKEYMTQFIAGENLETLWGYYDLQIRRYMPMRTYSTILTEISWLTGEFEGFGEYRSFEEKVGKHPTKTHVLRLHMEKQDMDLYFTHKNSADDWEVMNLEFVPAGEQKARPDAATGEEKKPDDRVFADEVSDDDDEDFDVDEVGIIDE